MKPKLLLIGGGGHCRSVIDVIEQENRYSIAGIVDKKELIGQKTFGYEIIGCDDDLNELFQSFKCAIVTVGQIKSPDIRIKLFNQLKSIGFTVPFIVSPRAYVSKHAFIGEGSIIMHDALVNANAVVGDNCIINSKVLIEHDCEIGSHCHISTGAIVNGGTIIGEKTFFGSNATSREYIRIDGFVKAGSIII